MNCTCGCVLFSSCSWVDAGIVSVDRHYPLQQVSAVSASWWKGRQAIAQEWLLPAPGAEPGPPQDGGCKADDDWLKFSYPTCSSPLVVGSFTFDSSVFPFLPQRCPNIHAALFTIVPTGDTVWNCMICHTDLTQDDDGEDYFLWCASCHFVICERCLPPAVFRRLDVQPFW